MLLYNIRPSNGLEESMSADKHNYMLTAQSHVFIRSITTVVVSITVEMTRDTLPVA